MNAFFAFIIPLILWVLLCWPLDWQILLVGIVVSIIVAALVGKLYPRNILKLLNPTRYFWFLVYLPMFFYYVVRANLDVAYRVIHPLVPINPGIVKVKTSLKSDMGRTFLANSITLTPGTLSVDIVGPYLYIHWINITTEDPEEHTAVIVQRFERLLRKVFE